ncbi:MAG: hypothetical protein M1118_11235 [Chloroflexi bacterium]|nr:hypothetical protein [Chloroflexota bacterium]
MTSSTLALHGIIPPLATPFTDTESFDVAALRREVEAVRASTGSPSPAARGRAHPRLRGVGAGEQRSG